MLDCRQAYRPLSEIPTPVAIFGCGYLGKAVASELHRQKKELIAYNRSGRWETAPEDNALPRARPSGLELRALDLTQAADSEIKAALEGVASAVFCYAPGRSGDAQSRRALYVDAPQRILALAGPELLRIVAVSSTSALPDLDAELDESCPVPPENERGLVQREAEISIARLAAQKGMEWCILRLAGLYGPGRSLTRIYRRYLEGDQEAIIEGDGHQATNFISRLDARNAVLQALSQRQLRAQLFHICGDDHRSRRFILQRLATLKKRPPLRWERPAPDSTPPRGKRVGNRAMKSQLGLCLHHPDLRFDFDAG